MRRNLLVRRKRVGRRLADHLARLVVDGVTDYAIFGLNPEGRIISWNAGSARITGYEEGEIVGQHRSILLPEEQDGTSELRIAADEGRWEDEGWRVRKNGEQFWANEVVSCIRNRSGHLIAYAVLLRDESAHRRSELARQRSEELFAGIVNLSVDAVVTVDESRRIVLYNQAAERMFGYPIEEAIGKPLEMLIPDRFREAHSRHFHDFVASPAGARLMGERRGRPLWGLRSTGEVFPIEAAISKSVVAGEVVLTGVVRDITNRVRQEKAREFLSRMAVVLDSSLDHETTLRDLARLAVPDLADWCTICLVDENGEVRRLEMAHADPALEEALKGLKDDTLGPIDQRYPALDVIESGEARLISPVPDELLEAITRNDDDLEMVRNLGLGSALFVPLPARGRVLGALGLFRAESSRPYDEFDFWLAREVGNRAGLAVDNARLYREARQAVKVRDEVLSVVSHDLRNPLNTIVLSSGLALLQLAEGQEPEAIAERIRVIKRSADSMHRMVEDLLDITRLESGRFVLERRPVSVASLLQEEAESLAPLADEMNLGLVLNVEPDLPRVDADPQRLHQILSNLIGNALKFTPPGGEITVGAKADAGGISISVSDTGVGIPAEHIPHLFDRFWQAQRLDRRGLGLGLPIVKGIVEAHDGHLRVESEEGVGSTFSLSLPAIQTPEHAMHV